MGLRTWICSTILLGLTLLAIAYTVFRADSHIIIFDSDADGRHELRMRHYRTTGGPLSLRWWFMLTRPAMTWIARMEISYRDLRGGAPP